MTPGDFFILFQVCSIFFLGFKRRYDRYDCGCGSQPEWRWHFGPGGNGKWLLGHSRAKEVKKGKQEFHVWICCFKTCIKRWRLRLLFNQDEWTKVNSRSLESTVSIIGRKFGFARLEATNEIITFLVWRTGTGVKVQVDQDQMWDIFCCWVH